MHQILNPRAKIWLYLGPLLMAALIAGCSDSSNLQEFSWAPAAGQPPTGELAHSFELPSVLGNTVSLDSYAGEKNVVLVFYRGFW